MPTGVWSKRIEAAADQAERDGVGNNRGLGLAIASATLCAVVGLGFRLKIQMVKTLAAEVYESVHGRRVRAAQYAAAWPQDKRRPWKGAGARGFDPAQGGFGPRWQNQQQSEQQPQEEQRRYKEYRARAEQYREEANARANAARASPSKEDGMGKYRQLLGVARGASKAELKTAYFKLAKSVHPDSSRSAAAPAGAPSSGAADFNELKTAYDVLRHEASS